MANVKRLVGSQHFTVGELVDIGRRLSGEKLDEMKLFSAVERAEEEKTGVRSQFTLILEYTVLCPQFFELSVKH